MPDPTPGEVGFVAASLPRDAAPVDPADLAAVTAGDALFGFDLLVMLDDGDNLMISPYSIATALSMLYAGARGETAEQIREVLHLTVPDETLHQARSLIDARLSEIEPPEEGDAFQLRPINSAWVQRGWPFVDTYLERLATHYGAGLHTVDFAADPEQARLAINEWVEEATEDRVMELVRSDDVDIMTVLVLVNAIWFQGSWANPFDPDRTSPGTFTIPDGEDLSVPFMRETIKTLYRETDDYRALRLPYATGAEGLPGDLAMVVVVPSAGSPAELASRLDLDHVVAGSPGADEWDYRDVSVSIPTFGFDADVPLTEVLSALGMELAFMPGAADLTGISESVPLYVKKVLHKTFIEVDESGTEAAAATAAVVNYVSGSLLPPTVFTADRPFLFWIEHVPTGEMLFLGQVTDPR